jgi:hypothetical protein
MFMTDEERRRLKEELIEIMEKSGTRRGSMLSPELTASVLNVSYRTIYRWKKYSELLPQPEVCRDLEYFIKDVKSLRRQYDLIVRHWAGCQFDKLDMFTKVCTFNKRWLTTPEDKELPHNEKVEQLVIMTLRAFADSLKTKKAEVARASRILRARRRV